MAPEPVQPDDLASLPPDEHLIRKQGTTRRAGALGDILENHSSHWIWGGTKTAATGEETDDTDRRVMQDQVHILLMVFAQERSLVQGFIDDLLADDTNGIIDPVRDATGDTPIQHETRHTGREHFGFRDGISQPMFPDSRKAKRVGDRWRELHQVAAGEFVLGYLNERDERAEVPSITSDFSKDHGLEHKCVDCKRLDTTRLDFGRNGTYLVARQLDQDVAAFDQMVEQTAHLIANNIEGEALPLQKAAELLVGRGIDGAPLSTDIGPSYERKSPRTVGSTEDDCDETQERNDFTFHRTDQAGMTCPIGSHVRRTNPRDSLEPNPGTSLSLSKQHRILRRGRIYGDEVPWKKFDRHKKPGANKGTRGLFFICLNTDIAGQFEFIQDTWINNPNFGDLEGERDPLLASSRDTRVSLPSKPFTRWFRRREPPVKVRGGAYFFLPGMKALRALAYKKDDPKDADGGTQPIGASPVPVEES
jgi:Dyp-type peroxidase family